MKKLSIGGLKAQVPIIQGGMGVGISLSGLASAVANEGAIGVISCAGLGLLYNNPSISFSEACILGLKEELRKAHEKVNETKKKARGIIGVNIMVAMSNFADMVKTSIAEKADIIFSGAGLPLNLPGFLEKESKTKLVPIVSSVRALKIICERWHNLYNYLPDAVVVEGPKAGGHLGYKENQIFDEHYSLEEILPQIIAETAVFEKQYHKTIPVIAAGGIYTGADIFRMMELGASGVQLGTRFVTTNECDASMAFKEQYINAKEEDIEIIKSPVGMPGRVINGSFIKQIKEGAKQPKFCPFHCIKTCDISKSPYCIMLALYNAYKGDFRNGFAFAGANAFRSKKIMSVKETISELMDEYKELSQEK